MIITGIPFDEKLNIGVLSKVFPIVISIFGSRQYWKIS